MTARINLYDTNTGRFLTSVNVNPGLSTVSYPGYTPVQVNVQDGEVRDVYLVQRFKAL